MAYNLSDKKHNYFYRITNQINWKYYFGIHSTDDLNDGYFGSSKLLKESIKKHGKENFHLTIIADYPTRKEASDHEKLAVTEIQVNDQQCYNVKTGGDNEFIFYPTDQTRQKMRESGKKRELPIGFLNGPGRFKSGIQHPYYGKTLSDEEKQLISRANKGKILSPETKKKMSESKKGRKLSSEQKENCRLWALKRIEEGKSMCKVKPCVIDGIEYSSIREASFHFKLSGTIISKRLHDNTEKWNTWNFIENGD